MEKDESILCGTGNEIDPVKVVINKCKKHPSSLRIKQLIKNPTQLYFALIDEDLIAKEIQNLNLKEAIPKDEAPVKILKLNISLISQHLSKIFNKNIKKVKSPKELKLGDITLNKIDNRYDKEN